MKSLKPESWRLLIKDEINQTMIILLRDLKQKYMREWEEEKVIEIMI